MSRPMSVPRVRLRPSSAKDNTDEISYEDELVAKYLNELRLAPNQGKHISGPSSGSPYSHRLANNHVVPTPSLVREALKLSRVRPQSAHVNYGAMVASPRDARGRNKRPQSAPTYKRPLSATYGSSRPTSAKSSARRVKSLYKRQSPTIVVTAYKNGQRDVFCRLAAPSIKVLLELCTEKLSLGSAARRLFLDDGSEVFTPREIPRDADVFISMGEGFKDPFKGAKRSTAIQKNMSWTVNGLVWSQNAKRKTTKPQLTKRFRNLIDTSRRRVLVFRNGCGSNAAEIVANPHRFEDFLSSCTMKLELPSYARILFDWEGREIVDLKDAPVLDKCLQTWATPVLGPLWVSKGEGFSPKGVKDFLSGLLAYTDVKIKEAKHYKEQLTYAKDEETKHKVNIVAILSMTEGEIDETLDIVNADIDEFSTALKGLQKQNRKIKDQVKEQVDEGHRFVMQHIEQFDSDHRMVGQKGLRLKIFENGCYDEGQTFYFNISSAKRGAVDSKMMMHRLLDECSACHMLALPKQNTCINTIAQKIYDKLGKEVKSVHDLEYDQEVWLSFGEPFKNPFIYVVTASFDKVRAFEFEGKQRTIKEQLMSEDVQGIGGSSAWEACDGVPSSFDVHTLSNDMDPMERDHMLGLMQTSEIFSAANFVKLKSSSDLLLFPDIVVDVKKPKGHKDLWPKEAQSWVLSKAGYIYLKAMPQLVLGVCSAPLTTSLSHPTHGQSDVEVKGFIVNLQKKQINEMCQQWRFTGEGFICNQSQPDLYLTFLGGRFGDEETSVKNREEGFPTGQCLYLAICDKLDSQNIKAQRWALKQERMDNLGQWKHTKVENPEWNKKALSWPVHKNGEYNDKMDWPVEGYLLPYAPSMKAKPKSNTEHNAPLRLIVMKNGTRDQTKAVTVVAPDLGNMKKDLTSKKNKKNMKNTRKMSVDRVSVEDDNMEVLELEFTLFLERCTSMLNLPFAARRLYDTSGKEHYNLTSLARDQLAYVSCGEAWSDPTLSKAEQQRRYLLNNLASDVKQIQQFVALREPQNLVLEVEGPLAPGSRLVVNENALLSQEQSQNLPQIQTANTGLHSSLKNSTQEINGGKLKKSTSHEISHLESERRLNNKRWPWERQNDDITTSDEDENAQNYSNQEMYKKFRPAQSRGGANGLEFQKFSFEDGFIHCSYKKDLVLGVSEADQESRVVDVVIVKKRNDDIYQRWNIKENGIIQSKHNPNMVLTVSMPSALSSDLRDGVMSYETSQVTLQAWKTAQFGRANQRWNFTDNPGFIEAFHTDNIDKEITASNRANVCTYAVMGGVELDQPGFIVEIAGVKGSKSKTIVVCASCARAMRGQHKIQRVKNNRDFVCAMGTAKEQGLNQVGSFQCLNGKVDLSTHEALHTLEEWGSQLQALRQELSVRAIAKQISAARVPYTVKVLAYKNGEGRIKPGHLLVGSSVKGILDQCAGKVGLSSAARRLYTCDGTLILDIDDLISWVQEQSVLDAHEQLKAEAKAKRGAKQGKDGSKLLSHVHFEDESEPDSESEDQEEQPPQPPGQNQNEAEKTDPSGQTEDASQSSDSSEDFVLGYRALSSQGNMDSWYNYMLIMNPMEEVKEDGIIVQWDFYAKRAGQIALQVLRPDLNDLTAFTLVDQISYAVEEPDEFSLDLLVSERTINVRAGDLLGMYCAGESVVPFDLDPRSDESPFWLMMRNSPTVGTKYKMDTWMQEGSRKYPFNIVIRPASKFFKKEDPPQQTLDINNEHEQQQKLAREQSEQKSKKKQKKGPHIEPPSVESVLRYPIEVWVSTGDSFIKPEKVEKNYEKNLQNREQIAAVSYELDKEKHVLRQMQGRRYEEQSPGVYRATCNPVNPVLIEQHWQEPTINEREKHDTVHQLQSHLTEVKASQQGKVKRPRSGVSSRLYTQPNMKRVLVHPAGQPVSKAAYVWGETIGQILDNSSVRLNLAKPAKYLYTQDGQMITDIAEVERDQLLCVSHVKGTQRFNESQQTIEVKANWGRTRRQHGPQSTEIVVTSNQQNTINETTYDVDPFGPSAVMGKPPSE